MKIRILDLFCGLGGVARGFQTYLTENGIDFEYCAVDIDGRILLAHKILNPDSIVIRRDAYSFTDDELRQYDFIWASPPCETHSRLNFYNCNDPKKFKEPDMRLYELIGRFYDLNIPFVVENVEPYYKPPVKPTVKVCRHILWSNLSIKPFKVDLSGFAEVKDDVEMLADYHELNGVFSRIKKVLGNMRRARDALRDMVHWKIAYRIAEQVIPQVLDGRKIVQLVLPISGSSRRREEGGGVKCL